MLTTGSIDYKMNEGLLLRQMSVDQFAIVAGKENIPRASKSKLFEAFRGVKALQNETAVLLWALFREIDTMCLEFEPFALDLKDGERVHGWLLARRNGELYSIVIDGLPAASQNQ